MFAHNSSALQSYWGNFKQAHKFFATPLPLNMGEPW